MSKYLHSTSGNYKGNDFIFEHKRLLVNTFLHGVKDDDSLVRASSLSNLSEVCLMLKDNIDDMLYEVVFCVQNVACYDKDVEPRRAAIYLISSLFRGLKSSAFKVLGSRLLEVYRMLRQIHSNDPDDVVRLQAKLSLDVLNENMKEFFAPKMQLEKKIHVLRPF